MTSVEMRVYFNSCVCANWNQNLDESIDNKALYDTFSQFGTVLSAKIKVDAGGNHMGQGWVQFETQDAAQAAVDKVDRMLLKDKQVQYDGFYYLQIVEYIQFHKS